MKRDDLIFSTIVNDNQLIISYNESTGRYQAVMVKREVDGRLQTLGMDLTADALMELGYKLNMEFRHDH